MQTAVAITNQDRRMSDAVRRESGRLRNFIRARMPNEADVEDVLQEVLGDLVEAEARLEPVRQAGAWLFRVARNRIIDRFRKHRPATVRLEAEVNEEGEDVFLESWLPAGTDSPEAAFARGVLWDELIAAVDELPPEQSQVFVAHELEGRGFKELADETGLSVSTLLSRKRYAVLQLRERLRDIYLEYITN